MIMPAACKTLEETAMSYIEIAYPTDKINFYSVLAEQLKTYTDRAPDPISALANASAVLGAAFSDINWVGFYLVHDNQLILGPFQGKPAVMTIGFGQGVCGTAWREKRAQVVRDVHCFIGHIACDCASSSELVVPVFGMDQDVIGVLDIDSAVPGRFDEEDAAGLADVVKLLAPFMQQIGSCLGSRT